MQYFKRDLEWELQGGEEIYGIRVHETFFQVEFEENECK